MGQFVVDCIFMREPAHGPSAILSYQKHRAEPSIEAQYRMLPAHLTYCRTFCGPMYSATSSKSTRRIRAFNSSQARREIFRNTLAPMGLVFRRLCPAEGSGRVNLYIYLANTRSYHYNAVAFAWNLFSTFFRAPWGESTSNTPTSVWRRFWPVPDIARLFATDQAPNK